MKNPIKKGGAWLENVIYRIHAKGYFLFHYSKRVCVKVQWTNKEPSLAQQPHLNSSHKITPRKNRDSSSSLAFQETLPN